MAHSLYQTFSGAFFGLDFLLAANKTGMTSDAFTGRSLLAMVR